MDAAALFASANSHFVREEYEEALKHYTCAATLQDDCAEYRAYKAAALLKLGKFAEAAEEANAALALDAQSHMALHWKGIALFYMGDFALARAAFEESQRAGPSAKAPRALWIRKCDAELSGSSLPLGGVVAEASKASPVVSNSTNPPPAAEAAPTQPAAEAAPEPKAGLSISGRKQIRREWYENNTHVFITVFAKGVNSDSCKADFQENSFSISFPLPGANGEDYNLDLDLFGAVDTSACRVEVNAVKVEVILAKQQPGAMWKNLERKDEIMSDAPAAYPTSSKQKKDWNQIDRDIEEEAKAEKPQGDEALNNLFREIYGRADDETRRAMNKSFQTSGGTVLSTNWGEVASSDYEGKDRPTPPDGQEWRDWRKK